MFRNLALGLIAAASLGIAALAPTGASAYDGGHHMRDRHYGAGFHRYAPAPRWHGAHANFRNRGCLQQRVVPTPYGPRYRTVNVCR